MPHPLFRRIAMACLMSCLAAASAAADTVSRYEVRNAEGAIVAGGEFGPPGGPVAWVGGGRSPGFQAGALQDPTRPQRLLLRLHEEPLMPYLQRQAEALRVAGGGPAPHAALVAARDHQRARLEREQQTLVDALLADGHVERVHGRYTRLTNAISVSASPGRLQALRRDPRVASLHPDHVVRTGVDASVPLIGADRLWTWRDPLDRPLTGLGMTVAILDTGIDYTHPDLGGCLGPDCKVRGGYDFANDDADPFDDNGHGTHVAGIVAADGSVRGVAPEARLLAYKVLAGGGWGYDSWIIAGLEAAVDPDGDPLTADHADVINLSLGGPGAPDSALAEAANHAVAAGSIVVAAAGNSGAGYWTIGAPGNARDVITVAASDAFDAIAAFSSRGPVEGEGWPKPDLTAPGVAIRSTLPAGGHGWLSGTSMAAPHVAGGAALLKQLEPGLTPARIRSRLAAGARPLGADLYTQGAGRLDLEAAAGAGLTATPALLSFGAVDAAQPLWQQQRTVVVRNDGTAPQAMSLAVAEALPAGAQLAVQPADFELAPGAEQAVTVTLDIDNALLGYATSGAFHYESAIAAGDALRIPLAFHKSAELHITVDTPSGYNLLVYPDDGNGWSFVSAYPGENQKRFRVSPGIHHAIATVWSAGTWAWLAAEDIEVVDVAEVELATASAGHVVRAGAMIDPDGVALGPELIGAGGLHIRLRDRLADLEFWMSGVEASSAALFRLPTLSARYELVTAAELRDPRAPPDAAVHYRPVERRAAGVAGDVEMSLDARSAGRIRFGFADPLQLGRLPHRIAQVSWDFRVYGPYLVGFGFHRFEPVAFDQPFSTTIFSTLRPAQDPDWSFLQPVVAELLDAELQWERFIASPGLLLFPRAGTYSVVDAFNTGDGTLQTSEPTADGDNEIVDGGHHFRSATVQHFGVIETLSMAAMPFLDREATMRDLNGNLQRLAPSYRLECAGAIEVGVHEGNPLPIPSQCADQPLDLRFGFTLDVLGRSAPSQLAQQFPAERPSVSRLPWLSHFELLDAGVPSRVLASAAPRLRLRWVGWDDLQHGLQLRLDRQGWRTLPTRVEGGFVVADLPVLTRLHLASLKLFAEDQAGRSEHTLNALFLLGQGEALPVFVDGFEPD
jgi:subtilisin family serine protease